MFDPAPVLIRILVPMPVCGLDSCTPLASTLLNASSLLVDAAESGSAAGTRANDNCIEEQRSSSAASSVHNATKPIPASIDRAVWPRKSENTCSDCERSAEPSVTRASIPWSRYTSISLLVIIGACCLHVYLYNEDADADAMALRTRHDPGGQTQRVRERSQTLNDGHAKNAQLTPTLVSQSLTSEVGLLRVASCTTCRGAELH